MTPAARRATLEAPATGPQRQGKGQEKVELTCRFPTDVYDAVDAEARAEDRSFNSALVRMLRRLMANERPLHK
jgi:hypothetical protein